MRQLKTLVKYAMHLTLLYLWLVKGVEMAGNLFKFYSYIVFLVGLCIAFSTSLQKTTREKGPVFPSWIWATSYSIVVAVLAATGHFWYAFMWFLASGGYYAAINSKEKEEKTEEAA